MKNNSKIMLGAVVIAIVVFAIAVAGISATRNIGKSDKTISTEAAQRSIDNMLKHIEVSYADPVKSQVDLVQEDKADELPDIDKNEVTVRENSSL